MGKTLVSVLLFAGMLLLQAPGVYGEAGTSAATGCCIKALFA